MVKICQSHLQFEESCGISMDFSHVVAELRHRLLRHGSNQTMATEGPMGPRPVGPVGPMRLTSETGSNWDGIDTNMF